MTRLQPVRHFKSSEHEYSGPKYGLAALERMHIQRHQQIAACDFRIRQLSEFPDHLDRIAQSSIKVVYAIYLDRYKRKSQRAAQETSARAHHV